MENGPLVVSANFCNPLDDRALSKNVFPLSLCPTASHIHPDFPLLFHLMDTRAFVGTNPTRELITSGLLVIRSDSMPSEPASDPGATQNVRRHGLDIKIPALKALAPTQSELPFLGTQVVVMLIFIVLGVLAARRFPAEAVHAA